MNCAGSGRQEAAYGIAAMGFYLPPRALSVSELGAAAGAPDVIARYAGARTVREAAPGQWPTDMATLAAREALERGGLDSSEVDLLIYCGGGVPDYVMPGSATTVQHALRAYRSTAFDLGQGCSGMLLAIQVAGAWLRAESKFDTALLVSGDKWSAFTRHHLADSVFFGDGGGALILRTGCSRLRPLSLVSRTRGEFHDLWRLEAGGLRGRRTTDDDFIYKCADQERAHGEFKQLYVPSLVDVAHQALAEAGCELADIAFFSMVNANLRVLELVADGLGIPSDRTSARFLREFGHFGPQDVFLNLDEAQKEGAVVPGDLILLLTTGIGFHWVAAVMQA